MLCGRFGICKSYAVICHIDLYKIILFNDVHGQSAKGCFRFQPMDDGILHKRLNAETRHCDVFCVQVCVNLRGKFVLKSGLLKVDIESYIGKFLLQTYKILFVGQNVGAKQLTRRRLRDSRSVLIIRRTYSDREDQNKIFYR